MITYKGRNKRTINFLKTIYFDYPEWTECLVGLMPATWMKYRKDLEELVLAHPRVFPGFKKGSKDYDHIDNPLYELGRRTDCWGTVWENIERGLDSNIVDYPLKDWSAFDDYIPPDPMKDDMFGPRKNWEQVKQEMAEAVMQGNLAYGDGLPHGFMYMRLYYLRSFDNFMIDLATDDPRLQKLIKMVEDYNCAVIRKLLSLGAEYMSFGEDLGLQKSLPMSPEMWRKYIKPSYDRMFKPIREADIPIGMHSDGNILAIIPDLIKVGVRLLNPQLRANGLEGLKEVAKGKIALNQDLDRQLFPFATPSQIEDHISEVYEELYLAEGGLMFYAECAPDVPLENIDAICSALEKICNLPEP